MPAYTPSVAQHRIEVLSRFDTFDITPAQAAEMQIQREQFQQRANGILDATKSSREQFLALTALEDAKYWTNQAIARHGVVEL